MTFLLPIKFDILLVSSIHAQYITKEEIIMHQYKKIVSEEDFNAKNIKTGNQG